MYLKKKIVSEKKDVVIFIFYGLTILVFFLAFMLPLKEGRPLLFIRTIIFIFMIPMLLKFFTYVLIGPWYSFIMAVKDITLARKYKQYYPRVSLLIPAWNEEVGIGSTLESVMKSNYHNLEVIIINDGSKDNTDKEVKRFIYNNRVIMQKTGISILYEYKVNEGKAKALNRGIALSSGEIIITIDADCIIKQNTIANFVKRFRDPKVMCVAGNVIIGNTQTILGIVQFFEFLLSFYLKKLDSIINSIYVVGGAAAAYRRTVFEKCGVFSEDCITEDIDLSIRIQESGMKIEFAADAIVYTEGAGDLKGLLKQRLRWKRGRLDTFRKFRHLFFSLKKQHNKLFTCLVLPLSLYAEIELFFTVFISGTFFLYALLSFNFSGVFLGLLIIAFVFYLLLCSPYKKKHYAPNIGYICIGWLLFYIALFVEYNALMKSLIGLIKKKEVKWQSWQRKGVFGLPAGKDIKT
ncbi:MAG: glycosyltransferase [Spirochaetales bacterium]|nr:glycosyltransferase [Spirochaetales bacterium]